MAKATPASEITLMVRPVSSRPRKAAMVQMGMMRASRSGIICTGTLNMARIPNRVRIRTATVRITGRWHPGVLSHTRAEAPRV